MSSVETKPDYIIALKQVENLEPAQAEIGFYKTKNEDKLARGSMIQVIQLNLIIAGLFNLNEQISTVLFTVMRLKII